MQHDSDTTIRSFGFGTYRRYGTTAIVEVSGRIVYRRVGDAAAVTIFGRTVWRRYGSMVQIMGWRPFPLGRRVGGA